MSIIDKALEANREYARNYKPAPGGRPFPKIAVVTCMDPRLSDLPGILGLPEADIDVIRTGRTSGNRRCSRGAHRFESRAWNHGDTASQSHRLRVHHIHR